LDPDIARVEWEKRGVQQDEAWAPIEGASGPILEDGAVERGVALEYRARAIDAAGQTSEWSTALAVTPEAQRMPAAPGTRIAKARSWLRRPLVIGATILVGLLLGVLWGKLARRRR
jgi:hypothetical protein